MHILRKLLENKLQGGRMEERSYCSDPRGSDHKGLVLGGGGEGGEMWTKIFPLP